MNLYANTLIVYFFIDLMAALALDLSIGLAGTYNFGFIMFQAAGAYAYSVSTLGPSSQFGGALTYIGGWTLPFPLPFLVAAACGGILALVVGAVVLRRLRADYQAVVLLAVMLAAYGFAQVNVGFVNGTTGLGGVPQPLAGALHLTSSAYDWFYAAMAGVLCAVVFVGVRAIYRSPYGRLVAALRENEAAVESSGRNVFGLRLTCFVLSGALAALSGALFVGFIQAWSPSSWSVYETILYFAVLVLGGVGNPIGALIGTLLLQIGITEGVTFLPQFGPAGLVPSLAEVLIGVLLISFLWFRPRGIVPERRRSFGRLADSLLGAQRTGNHVLREANQLLAEREGQVVVVEASPHDRG